MTLNTAATPMVRAAHIFGRRVVGGVTSLVMRQSSWYGKVGRIGPISLPGLLLALALAALIAVEVDEQLASAADTSARQIEAGQNHACVLDSDGRVTCWGEDAAGQVSDWGKWRYRSQKFSEVSAGSFFTCGILTNGSVMCWGYPEQDNGTNRESDNLDWGEWTANVTTTYTGWVNTPPSTVKFKPGSLSVGNYHACAIKTNGELACWGKAGDARLVIPEDNGAAITDWTMVEAGWAHACAIREGGSVVCFGRQTYDRSKGPSGQGPFVDVTLGVYNGCALARDGSVECWGGDTDYNSHYQGDPDSRSPNEQINTAPPGVRFTEIEMSTTEYYSCGLDEDGAVHCWGWQFAHPAQANAPAGSFASISVGSFANCALDAHSALTCWGIDDGGLFAPPKGTFIQTDGGDGFNCALKSDGTIDCWGGLNSRGQLDAPATGTFALVSAGSGHACALKSDGTVACWGGVGPAGPAMAGQTIDAARAPTSTTFTTLDAGPDLTCGVKTDGTLQCWGATTHNRQTVPGGGFSRVAVGATHVCAIKSSDQSIECWGEKLFFDFEGNDVPDDIGGKGNHTSTIPPTGTHRYTDITAGEGHTCAIRDDKKAVCWGYHADSRYAVPGVHDDPQGFGSINYVDIATGGNPNCAIRESDGSLSCWNTEKSQYLPSREILAMKGFKSLGAGTRHMCGIDSGDGLVCWGAAGVIPFPSRFSRPLATPTPMIVTNVRVRAQETIAVVSWDALEGADGYTVEWTQATRGEPDWARASDQNVLRTSTTVRRLRYGTEYAFRVSATNMANSDSEAVIASTESDEDDGASPFATMTPTPTATPAALPATPIPPTSMVSTSTAATLRSGDGSVTLEFPAGSRSDPYQVNFESETGCTYPGAKADVTFTCVSVLIFDSEDMLEMGVELDTPATLTFRLTAEQVEALGGEFLLAKLHEMGGLMILTRASAGAGWTAVSGTTLTFDDETGGATLTASVSNFSSFTAVADQATYDTVQEMYGHLLPRDTLTPPTGGPSLPGVALLALLLGSVALLTAGWILTARRSGA